MNPKQAMQIARMKKLRKGKMPPKQAMMPEHQKIHDQHHGKGKK